MLYKNTPVGEIPIEWEVKKLGEVGVFSKGKGITKEQVRSEGLPCIRYGEIYTTHDYIIKKFVSYIEEDLVKESQKIKKNDILFAGSGETIEDIGKSVAYTKDEIAFAGGDIIILSTNETENAECIAYLLETDYSRKQKRKFGQGNSVVHIYSSSLSTLKIALPPLPEQRRIATLLSTWDSGIATLGALLAELQNRKKYLAQQLLSGKKRVFGFEEKWKEVDFERVITRIVRKNDIESTNVVTISAQRGFVRQEDFFSRKVASETLTGYYLIKEGEFAYNKSYSNGYPMGAFKRLNGFKFGVVTTLYICFSINEGYNSNFLVHFFENGFMNNSLSKIAQEGGRAHGLLNIGLSDFLHLQIKLPSYAEQTAIAKILDQSECEIELVKQQLAALKLQKKGLMQILLTGKKRLK